MSTQDSSSLKMLDDKLVLCVPHFSPLFVDFSPLAWESRRKEGKSQGLVRACKPKLGLNILDVTAGWGKDAAILASFGAKVVMIERQPVMVALLEDGLRRMPIESALDLSLVKGESKEYLKQLKPEEYPDVIYIDPMHPPRQKTALVKKEMQILQKIIGPDLDVAELITLAISRCTKRVVVKWPERVSPLLPSNASIRGQTVRFDLYFAPTIIK